MLLGIAMDVILGNLSMLLVPTNPAFATTTFRCARAFILRLASSTVPFCEPNALASGRRLVKHE